MDPIITLFERTPAPAETLPAALAEAYGGGLVIPEGTMGGRPYLLANFVESLDGIVSYEIPGQPGSAPIGGGSEGDHATMGLLRAMADAVLFGSGSLHEDGGHLRTPAYIYRPLADAYAELRARLGRQPTPISVVLSGSGKVDLDQPTFHTPGLRALIATTEAGAAHLANQPVPAGTEVWTLPAGKDGGIAPAPLLERLGRDHGVRVAVHEGGPGSLAPFLAADLLDEQFLTLSPTLVGRAKDTPRLGLVEGIAYTPDNAPWATLLSAKLAGSHLLLRYRISRDA